MNLEELVNDGMSIKLGIKFMPANPGIIRTFPVYKLHDSVAYSTWKNKCLIYIRKVLQDDFTLKRFEEQGELFEKHHHQPSHLDDMIGILNAYLTTEITEMNNTVENIKSTDKIFIVHGHNEGVNQEVARTIEQLGLKSIILREQSNSGQTIIEKFESHANNVNFAIILLTADDKTNEDGKYRARQNVIFEMGYFMGALGRKHVMCIRQEQVETPSDIDGVVYTTLDKAGTWKFSMIKELKACGYDIDANSIM